MSSAHPPSSSDRDPADSASINDSTPAANDTVSSSPTPTAFLQKQESSVRHLQQLYTIVSGLALSDAISTIFREDTLREEWLPVLSLLLAFVATLIPFFHGAMRHLDDAYLLDESAFKIRPAGLAVDFFFLFAEGLILFALAHWLGSPDHFISAAITLLVVDIVWAVISHLMSPHTQLASVEPRLLFRSPRRSGITHLQWVTNNSFFVLILTGVWATSAAFNVSDSSFAVLVALTMILRTARDYHRSWSIYFPSPEAGRT